MLEKIKEFRRKRVKYLFWKSFLSSFSSFIIGLFLYILFDLHFNFSPQFSVIYFGLVLFISFVWFLPLIFNLKFNLEEEAQILEKTINDKKNIFTSWFNFSYLLSKKEIPYSKYLLKRFLDKAPQKVKDYDFKSVFTLKGLKFQFLISMGSLVLFLSLFILFGEDSYFSFVKFFRPYLTTQVKVNVDYPKIVLQGESIEIKANIKGRIYTSVKLVLKDVKGKVEFPFKLNSYQEGSFQLTQCSTDFSFYFKLNRSLIGPYQVKVYAPPRISNVIVKYHYPPYTGITTEYQEENPPQLYVLAGSSVEISFLLNRAQLSYSFFTDEIPLESVTALSREVRCSLLLEDEGKLGFKFTDELGFGMSDYYFLKLKPLEDRAPEVRIFSPGKDIDFPSNKKIKLEISADDDFGFSKIDFVFILNGKERRFHLLDRPLLETTFYKKMEWNLSSFSEQLGEDIVYWVEAWDNDEETGPKKSTSKVYKLKVRTQFEKEEEFVGKLDNTIKDLEQIQQEQKSIFKEAKKILEKKRTSNKLTFSEKRKIEQLKKRQQELKKKATQIMKKFNQEVNKLQKQKLMDPELMEKIAKLQQLFKEVVGNKLAERLKDMKNLLNKIKLSRQDIEKFKYKFDSKRLKEDLERMIKLMKRIRDEKRLKALCRAAQKLKEEQDALNKELEKINKEGARDKKQLETLARKQKLLQKQLELMKEEMKKFAQTLPYHEKKLKDKLLSTLQQLKQQQLSQKMAKNSKQIKNGDTKQAQEMGKKLSQSLSQLSQSLQSAQQMMSQMRGQENMADTDYLLDLLFLFSFREEELENEILSNYYIERHNDEITRYLFDNWALSYFQLKDLFQHVEERLNDLAGKTFFLGTKLIKASRRIKSYLNSAGATLEKQRLVLYKLQSELFKREINQLIYALLKMRQKMKSSGSGTGAEQFMQMMEKMISRQRQLMQKTQQLLQKYGSFQNLPQNVQEMLKQMAYEQMMIRQMMEQMMRKMGKLSDYYDQLNNISKEMKEIEKAFRGGKLSKKLVRKQQRLVEKMLETKKSIYKKKFSKKRYARKGEMYNKNLNAKKLELSQKEKKRKEYQFKPLESEKVPVLPGYEEYINDYFKAINDAIEGK